jgi:hypothetical protein
MTPAAPDEESRDEFFLQQQPSRKSDSMAHKTSNRLLLPTNPLFLVNRETTDYVRTNKR